MDDLRFKELLGAYGADLARWPEAEREAGRARLAAAAVADVVAVKEAAALDALLAESRDQPAPAHLLGQILAAAPAASRDGLAGAGGRLRPALAPRAWFAAASFALVAIGAAAGWSTGQGATASAAGDELLAAYDETADELFAVEDL